MLKIGFDRSEREVPLGGGASLTMRPATSIEVAAAEAEVRPLIAQAIAGVDVLSSIGIAVPAAPLLSEDTAYVIGVSRLLAAVALAKRVVTGWAGISDVEGRELAFDPKLLAPLFLENDTLKRFEAAAYSVVVGVAVEGEASAPSPTGSPAVARSTAGPARRKGSPAPKGSRGATGNSARKSNTGRRPGKP